MTEDESYILKIATETLKLKRMMAVGDTYQQGAIAAMEKVVANELENFTRALQRAFLEGASFGLKSQQPEGTPAE